MTGDDALIAMVQMLRMHGRLDAEEANALERAHLAALPNREAAPDGPVAAALAEAGLPATATVNDLIRHHRNNEAAANGAWKIAYDALAANREAAPTAAECPEPDCRKVAGHSAPHFPVPGDGTPDSLRGS